MATENKPKKVTGRKAQEKLRDEAFERAYDDAMDQLSDGPLKKELEDLYEKYKKKLRQKARKEAEKLAKKLLKKLLDKLGAGKVAGPMWWFWKEAGKLGKAFGQMAAAVIKKTMADSSYNMFSNLSLEEIGGHSEGVFKYVIVSEMIIVDKADVPVDAKYTIHFKTTPTDTELNVSGSTGSDGYDHQATVHTDRNYPVDISSIDINVTSINSVKYTIDVDTVGGICQPNTCVIFFFIAKAIVAAEDEGEDFFSFLAATTELVHTLPATRTFKILDAEVNFDRVELPAILGKQYITGSFIPGGTFTMSLKPSDEENLAEATIDEISMELAPIKIMGKSTGKSRIILNESVKNKGYYDLKTREFEISCSNFVMNDLYGEERLTFYGKVIGAVDKGGTAYVLGRGKDVYPKKFIHNAKKMTGSLFYRIPLFFRNLVRKIFGPRIKNE